MIFIIDNGMYHSDHGIYFCWVPDDLDALSIKKIYEQKPKIYDFDPDDRIIGCTMKIDWWDGGYRPLFKLYYLDQIVKMKKGRRWIKLVPVSLIEHSIGNLILSCPIKNFPIF